jgi:steroid 5-alpha reductase family enzyme
VFGKKLSDYIRFENWILILIAVVWAIRLGVSLAGTSFTTTRWVSINIVLLVGLIYCSVAVHTTGFGSYKQLFGLLLIQTVLAHFLIATGIIVGIVTGATNAYTTPEVFGGQNGASWFHVMAHVIVGPILSLISWLIGSAILFVTKKVKGA